MANSKQLTKTELQAMTVDELKKVADERGVEVQSGMLKADIVSAIEQSYAAKTDTARADGVKTADPGTIDQNPDQELVANPTSDPDRFGGRFEPTSQPTPVQVPRAGIETVEEQDAAREAEKEDRKRESIFDQRGRASLGR